MDIGHKIKQLRIQKGLTLEELASRSELTKGFLSQTERNLTSPSIATLNDIVEALGTSLSEFFKEDKEERIVFRKRDFFVDERDHCTVNWIVPNTQKNEMEPILLELPQGGESFAMDPHSGEEFGYIIEGSVVLISGERTATTLKMKRKPLPKCCGSPPRLCSERTVILTAEKERSLFLYGKEADRIQEHRQGI